MKKIGVLLSCLMMVCGTANSALIKSYDFNGGYSDTLGNGVDIVASGGSITSGVYNFSNNQGLELSSALANTSDYAIEMSLSVNDSLSGWNKLIDFENLSSDNGFYLLGDAFNFYVSGGNTLGGPVVLNEFFNIAFVRSAGVITTFFNGTALTPFSNSGAHAIPSNNTLNFFEDDFATSQSESFAGAVDFIRIHDDASTFGIQPTVPNPTTSVPEPSTLAVFALGIMGLASRRFMKQS
jgi:hypothetical protein